MQELTVVVQIFDLIAVHANVLDTVAGLERALKGCTAAQVAQFGANGRVAAPWLVMGIFEHFVDIFIYGKSNPLAEVVDIDHGLSLGTDFSAANYNGAVRRVQYTVVPCQTIPVWLYAPPTEKLD